MGKRTVASPKILAWWIKHRLPSPFGDYWWSQVHNDYVADLEPFKFFLAGGENLTQFSRPPIVWFLLGKILGRSGQILNCAWPKLAGQLVALVLCEFARSPKSPSPQRPFFEPELAAMVHSQQTNSTCLVPRAVSRCALILCGALLAVGCNPLQISQLQDRFVASNQRDWSPQFRILPKAVIAGDQITIYNIRNNVYVTEKDFLVQHYDRLFQRSDIRTVDFIVVPFQGMEAIAHTMLSFGLADGTYIAVSVEVRTEKGESYTTALGLSREFEITYVVADERDVIRLRTRHRKADVYIYPSRATPEQAQRLFLDMMERVNSLAEKPEFYDTIKNNCTNNLVRHVNRVFPDRIPSSWRTLLSGFSDRYAYDLGLLDQRVSFEELRRMAYINDLADANFDAPDFSQKIRTRLKRLEGILPEVEDQVAPVESASRQNNRKAPQRWAALLDSWQNQGRTRPGRRHRGNSATDPDPVEVSIEE